MELGKDVMKMQSDCLKILLNGEQVFETSKIEGSLYTTHQFQLAIID